MDFELRQLRQFLIIAEQGGFRPASERLHITQPALSVSIRKLEEALGVTLFDRGHRGVSLTAAGAALLPQIRRIVAQAEQSKREAGLIARGELGIVRVGFVGSAVYRLLPSVLPGFRAAHPNVQLDLIEGTSATLLPKLRNGEVDVALVRQPLPDVQGLRLADMEDDNLVAVLPRNHPLAGRPMIDLAELANDPFVIFSRNSVPGLNTAVYLACRGAGFEPRVTQEVTQATTLIGLVGSGLGVALAPSVIAEIAGTNVVFVRLFDESDWAPLLLAIAAMDEPGTAAVERFWLFVTQHRARNPASSG